MVVTYQKTLSGAVVVLPAVNTSRTGYYTLTYSCKNAQVRLTLTNPSLTNPSLTNPVYVISLHND